MGRRTDTFFAFVRHLRTTDPKYSFEIVMFHGCLLIACTVLLIMDEYKLFAITAIVLWFSLGIQTLRIRWVIKRKRRELEDLIQQSYLAYLREMNIAAAKKNNQEQHTAETARLLTLLREDVEQARKDADQSCKKMGELLDG